MAQGVLPLQYEAEKTSAGVTTLGDLLVYLDPIKASGLCEATQKYVKVSGMQGWPDLQMILGLLFLNLARGGLYRRSGTPGTRRWFFAYSSRYRAFCPDAQGETCDEGALASRTDANTAIAVVDAGMVGAVS